MDFPLFLCILGSIVLLRSLVQVQRTLSARMNWKRTEAKIRRFIFGSGIPRVVYRYSVDGVQRSGSTIIPGISPFIGREVPLPASFFAHNGRLTFRPGAEVPLFYNPKNPKEAALLLAWPPRLYLAILIGLGLITLGAYKISFDTFFPRAWMTVIASIILFQIYGVVREIFRGRRESTFPSVKARLIHLEAEWAPLHHSPKVLYRYKVDGVRYYSLDFFESGPPKPLTKADALDSVRKLTPDGKIEAFYDPESPWKAVVIREKQPPRFLIFLGYIIALVWFVAMLYMLREMATMPFP